MTSPKNAALRMPRRAHSIAHWQRAPIWIACALVLTSCASGTRATRPTIPAPLLALLTPIPPVSDSLTVACPALPIAQDDRVATLLRNHTATAALYHQCAGSQAGLSAAARERERIEAARIARATQSLQAGD